MEVIILLIVVGFVAYCFSSRKDPKKKTRLSAGTNQASRKRKDEMAGSSITALFLLEEVVDDTTARTKLKDQAVEADTWFEQDCEYLEWGDEDHFD